VEFEELHTELKNAYIESNLNLITGRIINSFRKKEFDYIQNLVQKLSEHIDFGSWDINKAFNKLIMTYHPDKLSFYQSSIEEFYSKGDELKLNQLSHIFITLKNLNYISSPKSIDSIITSARVEDYGYAVDINEFDHVIDSTADDFKMRNDSEISALDFLSALKLKEHGNLETVIHMHDLETLDGVLDFSGYGVNDLSGIENCINISILNFSDNDLADITKLGFLNLLEEIYLSNNEIYSVDGLSQLNQLKILDVSNNNIDDISALVELPNLHYLNVIGNPLSEEQIKKASRPGRIIIH